MNDLVEYSIPTVFDTFDISFIASMKLEHLESGIRELGQATDLLALVQGVAIVKIEKEGLWIQAGYPNLRAYRIAQAKRLDMPRATISLRRQTADSYLTYREELNKIDLNRKVSHLRYLSDAVVRHGKDEAIEALQAMTYREFASWANPSALEESDREDVELSFRKGDIVIDGKTMGKLSEDIPPSERDFIAYLLRSGYKARKNGNIPYVISLKAEEDIKIIKAVLKKHAIS